MRTSLAVDVARLLLRLLRVPPACAESLLDGVAEAARHLEAEGGRGGGSVRYCCPAEPVRSPPAAVVHHTLKKDPSRLLLMRQRDREVRPHNNKHVEEYENGWRTKLSFTVNLHAEVRIAGVDTVRTEDYVDSCIDADAMGTYLQRAGEFVDVWRFDPDTVQVFAGTEHIAAMSGPRARPSQPAPQPSVCAYPLQFGRAMRSAKRVKRK